MNGSDDLTPDKLFKEFTDSENSIADKKQAVKDFSEVKDKTIFLEPAMHFISKQVEDEVRSWGTNVLEIIGGKDAFKFLIDLLKKETSRELKRNYLFTRFFALRAIQNIASSDHEREEVRILLDHIWPDIDEDFLIRAEALILIVREEESELIDIVKDMLKADNNFKEQEFWAPLRCLRALREFQIPSLADDIIFVLQNSKYIDVKYQALAVLGYYNNNLKVVRALGDIVIDTKKSNRYLRLTAVGSLAKLENREAEYDLLKAIQDEDAEIREQACYALKNILKEDAVSIIVQHALKEGTKGPGNVLNYSIDAIRRIEPDGIVTTEILKKELGSEDKKRTEVAEKILIELGGWAAFQTLSQRRSTLDKLDKLLAESENTMKGTFQSTIRQAIFNFYFAMIVNIIIVMIGIILIALAINQFIQRPEELKNWIIPGGAGALGILINLVFNNPRNNARSDFTALENAHVVFLGFLRQLNVIDATFKKAYLESHEFGLEQMQATVTQIENSVTLTLAHNQTLLGSIKIKGDSG